MTRAPVVWLAIQVRHAELDSEELGTAFWYRSERTSEHLNEPKPPKERVRDPPDLRFTDLQNR